MRRYSASVRLDRPVEVPGAMPLGSKPKHSRAMMFKVGIDVHGRTPLARSSKMTAETSRSLPPGVH